LENNETAQFIFDFVEKKGGPPPIPPRSRGSNELKQGNELKLGNNELMHENIPISTSPPVGNDSRSSLMESIRNSGIGVLKKTPSSQGNSSHSAAQDSNDMASLLATALANRRLASNDSNCSSDDD